MLAIALALSRNQTKTLLGIETKAFFSRAIVAVGLAAIKLKPY